MAADRRPAARAEVLAVGDELVHGFTIDTNSAWLARELERLGIQVDRLGVVSDHPGALRDAVVEASARCDVVLITGGLGPTKDDRTREACAAAAGVGLVHDDDAWRRIQSWFCRAGRAIPESNRIQASFPEGAQVIANDCGTAPGFSMAVGRARVYAMPGVPREMRQMFETTVRDAVRSGLGIGARPLALREIHLLGPGEATLGERIADLMAPDAEPRVGITARDGVLTVRVAAVGNDEEAAARAADAVLATVRVRIDPGERLHEGPESLGAHVARLLTERGLTVATAESCTGGLIAGALTERAGVSAVFGHGWVTYSDRAKVDLLGVDTDLIARHGAVSEPVAAAMAEGAREKADADLAVSVSGIAGPGGGTDAKPVGTVCFGLAERGRATRAWTCAIAPLGRGFVRRRSVHEALAGLLRVLMRGDAT